MISSLRGRALAVGPDSIVVDVQGVGYAVAVPTPVARAFHPGDEIVLHTHLAVREDALSLYGFESRDELSVFTQLLGVAGVGPKSALGVLSAMTVDSIAQAIADDDDAPFRRVSGIGPKTAKLIVVQLAGKLAPPAAVPVPVATDAAADVAAQVAQALVGLGWSERVAVEAVAAVPDGADRATVGALLRVALAALGPARLPVDGGPSHG